MAASNAKSKQEYDMANKSVVQKCNAYNKITGKLVYKKDANTREDTNCDRTGIQDCTEWKSTPGPDGKPLKWFTTDNQGNICNKEKQEFNESGNFYRTDDRKTFESINGGIVPLKNPPKLMNGMPYPYTGEDKYEMFYQPILRGGRRKSRKSRR